MTVVGIGRGMYIGGDISSNTHGAMMPFIKWMDKSPWIGRRGLHYVYIHSTPAGVPFYIGKGNCYRAFRVKHRKNPGHIETVSRYGAENIRVSLIECESEDDAFELEKSLIKEYRCKYNLVNVASGGCGTGGYKHTDDARLHMSISRTGRRASPEHRAAIGAAHKGLVRTDEARAAMSRAWTPERRQALIKLNEEKLPPSKRPGVGAKISAAKTGMKRPDLTENRKGKCFVHRDGVGRMVAREAVALMIQDGWLPGLGPRDVCRSRLKRLGNG